MKLPPTPRVLFLRELVGEVTRSYGHGRTMVAVDGVTDTAPFADDLAEVFREAGYDTFRASMTDFHRPRADRTRLGPESALDYYRGAGAEPFAEGVGQHGRETTHREELQQQTRDGEHRVLA